MKRWNIPAWLEQEIVRRDKSCVYCGVMFGSSAATIPVGNTS
jgi:hypothetical protein